MEKSEGGMPAENRRMAAVTKVHCPRCKQLLRIPTAWLERPIRCRHCAKSFRAALKEKPAAPPPVPTTAPAAETENAFAFDAESVGDLELIPVTTVLRYQPRRSGGLKWAMVAGIIGTLVAIGGGVYYKNTNAGPADAGANVDRSSEATVASTAESAKTLDLPKAATNFPRRFLAVSIHNYLYANPVSSARRPHRHGGRAADICQGQASR